MSRILALHKRFGTYLAIAISLSLFACGGFPTAHPDAAKNNLASYKGDIKDCVQSYPETPDGIYLKHRIACMKLKGWQ
jgi:hypothetical protein